MLHILCEIFVVQDKDDSKKYSKNEAQECVFLWLGSIYYNYSSLTVWIHFYGKIVLFPFTNLNFLLYKYLFVLEDNLSHIIVSFKILFSYCFFIMFLFYLTE